MNAAPPDVAYTAFPCRRRCGGRKRATRTQQMLRVKGRQRLHVAMICETCGDETWSRHHLALQLARELDAAAHTAGTVA